MKIYILIIVAIFSFAGSSFSQDLIVTNEGDTINCKITKVKKDVIYFISMQNDELRSNIMHWSKIKAHQFNYFKYSEVPLDKIVTNNKYQNLRLAFNIGYGYQTAKISESVTSDLEDYVKELRSGYQLGADIAYYFSNNFGIGARYNFFRTSNSMNNIAVEDIDGNIIYGKMSDDVRITFVGPVLSARYLTNIKDAFLMNITVGYLGYVNDAVLINRYKITGNTVGFAFDIGYDFAVAERVNIGFQLSYLVGKLSEFIIDDGSNSQTIQLEDDNQESINRLDFSVGIRFLI